MKCYASRTGTKRNLDALREAGWGLLLSPAGVLRDEGFEDIVLDNGKWTAHTTGEPWDQGRFMTAVDMFGHKAQWLLVPDKVGDGSESLRITREWLPILKGRCPLLLVAVQDGMTPEDVKPLLGPDVGIFLGGSTEWKLDQMGLWGAFAEEAGIYYHVARVNSEKRMHLAEAAGAHSTDGSGPSRRAIALPPLERARRQPDLFNPRRRKL